MFESVRYLLFQARKPGDPMRGHELACFARALGAERSNVRAFDLFRDRFTPSVLAEPDVFLFGGSGDYSVAEGGERDEDDWMPSVVEVARAVHASGKPTFASCWGFQALARAMGGRVEHDPQRAEVGTHELFLTEEGARDPVLGRVEPTFKAQMGHEDHVVELPPDATRLASSARSENQAYRFDDAPIYCTQFHPELRSADLEVRFARYPRYLEELPNVSLETVRESLEETPSSEAILLRFLEHHLG